MKKILVLILSVIMIISFCSVVFAEENQAVTSINWEDVEGLIAEEASLEGEFFYFDEVLVKMHLPKIFRSVLSELTEEERTANNIIQYFVAGSDIYNPERVISVTYADWNGITLEQFKTEILEAYYELNEVGYAVINGIDVLIYVLADSPQLNHITIAVDNGYLLEFSFGPFNNEFDDQFNGIIAASIQPYEIDESSTTVNK